MRSCENAIGIMNKLETGIQVEESFVDGTIKKIEVMPTATSAFELDVSTNKTNKMFRKTVRNFLKLYKLDNSVMFRAFGNKFY